MSNEYFLQQQQKTEGSKCQRIKNFFINLLEREQIIKLLI